MRRLALLCLAAAAAVSGYNLVLQEIQLTGDLVKNDKISCEGTSYVIHALHVGSDSWNVGCYNVTADDGTLSINVVYQGPTLTSKAKTINYEIVTIDGETITFALSPDMKTGQMLTSKPIEGKYVPLATVAPSTTTVAPPTLQCVTQPKDAECPECKTAPPDPLCKPVDDGHLVAKLTAKAKKTFVKLQPDTAAGAAVVTEATVSADSALPAATRFRGPGPVRPPIHNEEAVVADEEEERRVRRAADEDTKPDSVSVSVVVTYYVLDEAGNPAAVWAAVIEGIILIVLVGLCFWFFFWSPRSRSVATAAEDPYKEQGPNYSVSYANSSYNTQNQRIDAFQNPPATPAAPPRPANSAYMDDYITDNIGAMSRPGAAATTTPAASAINPSSSAFQPGHQRFDSSGLVTVNLS